MEDIATSIQYWVSVNDAVKYFRGQGSRLDMVNSFELKSLNLLARKLNFLDEELGDLIEEKLNLKKLLSLL